METRNIIDIPDHPTITGITRKAQVRKSDNYYEIGRVEMVINVFSYFNGVELKDMFRQITMVCSNENQIDTLTFDYVNEGGSPEYDYLFNIVKSKIKTQLELEEMYIGLRIDKINEKMYN